MSKSLKRVIADAEHRGLTIMVRKMEVSTKTAQQAADAIGATVDQIAKSIIFRGSNSGKPILFLTAGANRVNPHKAELVAGESLGKADAAFIRETTGFAIGGVSPIGHTGDTRAFWDPRLDDFDIIWAAAGTPHHMFDIAPEDLRKSIEAERADFTAAV